jgi:uncharacterized SAM-binding protein YcdF (DUF218 family)
MIILTIVTASIFILLAVFHLYWGLGGLWPGKSVQDLVNKVLGKGEIFPSLGMCLFVSFGLLFFSVITLLKFNLLYIPFLSQYADLLLICVGAIFGFRSIVFFLPKLKQYGTSEFRRLNKLVYAPLCFLLLSLTFVLSFEYLFMDMVACPSKLDEHPSKAILYFSADGASQTKLNYISKYRLDHVIKIHSPGQRVFLNGHANAKPPTVKLAMAYLVKGGINKSLIHFETKSTNTWENILFGLSAVKKMNLESVTMVSSPYHIERILRYYKKQNKTEHYNLNVTWDSYNHINDDLYPSKKAAQILHEILGTIRDTVFYGNEISSGWCR